MAKVKFGNLLKTAAAFIPGAGPYVAAADALFGSGQSRPERIAGGGLSAAAPFIEALTRQIPQSEELFRSLIGNISGLQEQAAAVDDNALLDRFLEDARTRLAPRIVESAISGPLAGVVSRGIGTTGTLAQNIVQRAAQDATERLLTEAMQRRLDIPDKQLARQSAILAQMAQIAGLTEPVSRIGALLPALTQGGLGAAQIAASQQAARAKGLASLLSGLEPASDFREFQDFARRLFARRKAPTISPLVISPFTG